MCFFFWDWIIGFRKAIVGKWTPERETFGYSGVEITNRDVHAPQTNAHVRHLCVYVRAFVLARRFSS